MILVQFLNRVLVFMTFMGHVITEPRVVVNAWAFNDRNNVIFVVIGIGVASRLVAAHRLPSLTLAHHEHRISWGHVTYLQRVVFGPVWLASSDTRSQLF